MTTQTATITGTITVPSRGKGASVVVSFAPYTQNLILVTPDGVVEGWESVDIDAAAGTWSITLPLTGQSGVLPSGALWQAREKTTTGGVQTTVFDLTADIDWADIVPVTDLPVTPNAVVEATAAAVSATADAVSTAADRVAVEAIGVTNDAMISSFNIRRRVQFDILDHGAKCDGVVLTDAAMTVGSPILTTAHTFTSADVGKTIAVMGAGTIAASVNDGVFVSTIASVAGGHATLAANAVTTCSAKRAVFGTPDDDAFDAARDAAVAAGGGVVRIPAGKSIVTRGHSVASFVSYEGLGREISWVHPIFLAPNSATPAQSSWLVADQYSHASPVTGLTLLKFGVEAEGMALQDNATQGPVGLKPLNVYNVKRCDAISLYVKNAPATAIPFDVSVDACYLGFNVIRNAGRLAAGTLIQGCSGIGVGIVADGSSEPTWIFGNSIFGVGNASTVSPCQNGIFVESEIGSSYLTPSPGYRISNNYIEGVTYGISERGGWGTVITGNVIRSCVYGFHQQQSDFLLASFHGIDTLFQGNVILDGTGPGASDGTGIRIVSYPTNGADSTNIAAPSRARILDNTIVNMKFRGVALLVGKGANGGLSTDQSLDGVTIRGNRIRSCGRSGIIATSTDGSAANLTNLVIHDNDVELCGTSAVSGDQSGVTVSADLLHPTITENRTYQCARGFEVAAGFTVGLNASGGRIQSNDFGSQVITGTIDPWVEVSDNDTTNVQWSDPLTGSVALIGTAVGTSGTKTWASASGQTAGTAALTRNSDGLSVPSNADSVHSVFGLFDTGKANHFAQATTAGLSGSQTLGVVVRVSTATNYWRLYPDSSNSNKWTLARTVSGTLTKLGVFAIRNASDTVKVLCSGDNLIVILNGVAQTPVNDSFNDTATLAGVFMSSSLGSTVRLSGFSANAV